jgi:trigger factor
MTAMETTKEDLGKDQVKLTVQVPEKALEPALGAAYKRWAKEIKVPGFRKGKVPRQLIDARIGPGVVREEALREALPDFYREALKAEEVEAIAPPEIEVTRFDEGAPLVFEATVDVRPEVRLPDLSTIMVDSPSAEPTGLEVDEQLDKLRDRFAELEPVSRDAGRGDHVLIDLKGSKDGEPVEGASAPDFLYEVGSQSGPSKLDDELQGSRPGSILKFTDQVHIHRDDEPEHDHSHMEEISFTVLVKEVKAKKLPPLDDEFAKTVGEFDTLEELRDDVRSRLAEVKKQMVDEEIRGRALTALVDAADLVAPAKLVDGEFNHRLEHIEGDLKNAGLTLATYAERSGSTELEIRSDMRKQAARSVKAELLLEQVAREQQIEVTEEDIGLEIAYTAARVQRDPKEVAEQIVSSGQLSALAGDVLRRKSLDHVVASIQVTGRPESSEHDLLAEPADKDQEQELVREDG